ncbi:NUDIX hydrolase [Chitinophaga horti]|uniref:GDP-mannose pyrophosphatase n=1 Tax=Chitinophaga horti TaxID=2920382 RepID=A0ABY6J848_9BACT|nr:NUDIX hydrolase [Chitinophaga horti]UYQ94747.1 NUDIX hydrolase [Chitinophaga horti]
MEWKVLQSEYLHREPWLTVRKDKAQTPAGKVVENYYVHEYPDWVTAVPVTEDGKIIMIRQYRHALGRTIIEVPGGTLDDTDPTPEFGIRRELLEETGYEFDTFENLGAVSANPSTNTNLTHMFLARGGKKVQEQQLDHNEDIEVILMTPEEVIQLLKNNQIIQSLHTSCLFYGLAKLGLVKF